MTDENKNIENNQEEKQNKCEDKKSCWTSSLVKNKHIVYLFSIIFFIILLLLIYFLYIINLKQMKHERPAELEKTGLHYIGTLNHSGSEIYPLQYGYNILFLISKYKGYAYILDLEKNNLNRVKIADEFELTNAKIFDDEIIFCTKKELKRYKINSNKLGKLTTFNLDGIQKDSNTLEKEKNFSFRVNMMDSISTHTTNDLGLIIEHLKDDNFLLCTGVVLKESPLECWNINFSNKKYKKNMSVINLNEIEEFINKVRISQFLRINDNKILYFTNSDDLRGFQINKILIQEFNIKQNKFENYVSFNKKNNYFDNSINANNDVILIPSYSRHFLGPKSFSYDKFRRVNTFTGRRSIENEGGYNLDIYSYKQNKIIETHSFDHYVYFKPLNKDILISNDLEYEFKINEKKLAKVNYNINIPNSKDDYFIFPVYPNRLFFIEKKSKNNKYKMFLYKF